VLPRPTTAPAPAAPAGANKLAKQARIYSHATPVHLRQGRTLPGFQLAYEVYGEMSRDRDNVILLFHALTGSQNAAGFTDSVPGVGDRWTGECQTGWWDGFIGPGLALDTSRFCVVCANYLGGCYGSTGPSSTDPATGHPYGSAFPRVTLPDIVDSQVHLLDHLGVEKLHAAIGNSIGGMMVLDLATRYPGRVKLVFPVATGMKTTTIQKLLNFEQILAIECDPAFAGGDYYGGAAPDRGLALARIISHKTFIHFDALANRARSEMIEPGDHLSWYPLSRHIESYMLHQGGKFVKRFDANTYLRIVDAWQQFDLLESSGAASFQKLFAPCRDQRYLVFSIDSDVCFYPDEQAELKAALDSAKVPNMHITVSSGKGHDSFLLEPELYTPHLQYLLTAR
jgi:homoserine O-acetyltransferase